MDYIVVVKLPWVWLIKLWWTRHTGWLNRGEMPCRNSMYVFWVVISGFSKGIISKPHTLGLVECAISACSATTDRGTFFKGWQSRISYRSPLCDIPLFRQRELWAVISWREGERKPWYNRGGYHSNCNFKHALFNNAVRSVKLQDYLHFEKHWQGNCRHVLWSPEVISQHLKRDTSFVNLSTHHIYYILRLFSLH